MSNYNENAFFDVLQVDRAEMGRSQSNNISYFINKFNHFISFETFMFYSKIVFNGLEGSTFVSDNQYIEQLLATASHDFHVYHQLKKEFVQFTLSRLRSSHVTMQFIICSAKQKFTMRCSL